MLTWTELGTIAGAVAVVHAVLFLLRRIWPKASGTIAAILAAEALIWAYGATTSPWSAMDMLLWTSNGLIVATVALGGVRAVQNSAIKPPTA